MNPTRVSAVPVLILAHLGIGGMAACHDDKAPVVNDPTTAMPSSNASATTVAVPSATSTLTATAASATSTAAAVVATGSPVATESPPIASAVPTASATATTEPPAHRGNKKVGEACRGPLDCAGGALHCDMPSPPPGSKKQPDGVCRRYPTRGRPLVVDGVAHLASFARGVDCVMASRSSSVTTEEVESLLVAAREEHASVAAFARTIAELMALGAPTWLLFETQTALADEIRHTDMSLAMIEHLTGERPVLGPLEAATLPLRHGREAASEFFRDVFRGGVIGETLAAAEAEQRRDEATDVDLRDFYNTIFEDESRHAALAFKTLRWLIDEHPSLAILRDEEQQILQKTGSFEARTLVTPLLEVLA